MLYTVLLSASVHMHLFLVANTHKFMLYVQLMHTTWPTCKSHYPQTRLGQLLLRDIAMPKQSTPFERLNLWAYIVY